MKYRVIVTLLSGHSKTLWEGNGWLDAKEKFNFWANEYRDEMLGISIEVRS